MSLDLGFLLERRQKSLCRRFWESKGERGEHERKGKTREETETHRLSL